MSNSGEESLIEQVQRSATQAKESAASAIAALASVADELDMRETAGKLRDTEKRLRSDTFNVIFCGNMKNGKSTLLNALMGGVTTPVDFGGNKGPMVVDDLPATARLTAVRYADEPYVIAWGYDGTSERWSLTRYLHESTLDVDEEESQRRLGHVREFEMGFPARLCEAGVTVIDSPGLNEHDSRTAITHEATKRCDAAIVVYRTDVLMGQNEMMNASHLVAEGTRVFTVINLWNGREVDDRLRAFVWNKYVKDYLGGPRWDSQDLASRDIYFLNAALARDARYDNDEEGLQRSRLIDFEKTLGDFLVRDRQHVHLARFTTQASALGDAIDKHVEQRRRAVQADQESLRQAYTEVLPRLTAIRARPKNLAKIFGRYCEEAQTVVVASFVQAVARMRQELPEHLMATPLPSGEKTGQVFRHKRLREEASQAVSTFVTERIDQWAEKDATVLLGGIVERLSDEVESEITTISRQYDEIHFDLTGWALDTKAGGAIVGTTERVLSAVAGLLLGDMSAALTGGAGGWRGAAGGIGGVFGSAFILGLIGVTSSAVFIPVTLAAALVLGVIGSSVGFEKRVKDKVREQTDPMLAALADEVGPKISDRLGHDFSLLQKTVTDEIMAVIDEEERNITQVVELNQRDQADRDHTLAQLNISAAAVAQNRLRLEQALTIAKQV